MSVPWNDRKSFNYEIVSGEVSGRRFKTVIRKAVFEPEGTIARYEKSYGY